MWKIAVGFAVFAGLALYMLSTSGDIDMGGEKHGAVQAPALVTPSVVLAAQRVA